MGLEQKGMGLPGMVHPCPGATDKSHRQGGSTTAPSTPAKRVSCTGTEAAPDRQPSGAASDRHGAGRPQPPALLLRRRRTAAAGVRAALRPARLLALLRDAARGRDGNAENALTHFGDLWHGRSAWFLLALVVGHIAMTVIHQRRGEKVLQRMAGRQPPAGGDDKG